MLCRRTNFGQRAKRRQVHPQGWHLLAAGATRDGFRSRASEWHFNILPCWICWESNLMETIWNLLAQRWYVVCLRLPGLMEARRGEHGNNDLFFYRSKCGKHGFFLLKWLDFWCADICYIFLYILVPPPRVQNWASGTGREARSQSGILESGPVIKISTTNIF